MNHQHRVVGLLALTVTIAISVCAAGGRRDGPTVTELGPGDGPPAVAVDRSGNIVVAWTAATPAGNVVRARRYSAADSHWSDAVDALAPAASNVLVAMDPGGDAVIAWSQYEAIAPDGYPDQEIRIAMYSASAATWRGPLVVGTVTRTCAFRTDRYLVLGRMVIDLPRGVFFTWIDVGVVHSPGYFATYTTMVSRYAMDTGTVATTLIGVTQTPFLPIDAAVAVDGAGSATTTWGQGRDVVSRRYTTSTAEWSAPVIVGAENADVRAVRLGTDAAGNVVAAWCPVGATADGFIRAARYDARSGAWGALATLVVGPVSCPEVAVAPSGSAVAIWDAGNHEDDLRRVQAAVYASGAWGPTRDLTPRDVDAGSPKAEADDLGNTTAVWWQQAASGALIRAARITAGGVVTTHEVTALDQPTALPAIAAANGLVAVVWRRGTGSSATVEVATWRWTPHAPAVTGIDPSPGSVTVHFTNPAPAPAPAPTNYEYSLDDGATWTPREPPSASSPLVVSGLTDFIAYSLRIRGVNESGPGAPTEHFLVKSGAGPNGPTGLVVTAVAGHTVTVAWTPPTVGLVPMGYVLEGGVTPGEVLASLPTGGAAPTFTFSAPSGVFYIRLYGVTGGLRSSASNEIRIVVNVAAAPSAPAYVLGLVDGSRLALSWVNTFEGGPPTSLWLQVSGSVHTTVPVPMGEAFTFAGVPPGTYTLSVVAANGAGASPPSNAVTLTFPNACTGAPESPVNVQAWKAGFSIVVSWNPAPRGPAVTSYVVTVGGAYTGSFSTVGRALSGAAAPGTYTLSVAAANSCGSSASTPAGVVVIP